MATSSITADITISDNKTARRLLRILEAPQARGKPVYSGMTLDEIDALVDRMALWQAKTFASAEGN